MIRAWRVVSVSLHTPDKRVWEQIVSDHPPVGVGGGGGWGEVLLLATIPVPQLNFIGYKHGHSVINTAEIN